MDDAEDFIGSVCDAVVSGGAVCLLGAGFAAAGTDNDGKPIPSTFDLVREIKAVIGLDHEDVGSLTDIADYCEDRADLQLKLRKLLLARLTPCKPSRSQKAVISLPWRSIFTTNFDDIVEACRPDYTTQVITPASNGLTRSSNVLPIYYMHGRARDLLETTIDPRLVLSERNYLRLHEDNRELYAQLQNELFAAKYIVLVGYSLRDLEVARLFIEAGHAFHGKTLIITGVSETPYSSARLAKFGHVRSIGLDGFADVLANATSEVKTGVRYNFVDLVSNTPPAGEITADDFVRLVLTGRFQSQIYQRQLIDGASSGALYAVRRSAAISAIVERPKSGVNRFVISSDLGNGKSVFLQQLSAELLAAGYTVVEISSALPEMFDEIDRLMALRQPTAYLLDDVIRYRVAAEYLGKRLNAVSIVVCCMRGDPSEVIYRDLTDRLGGAVKQIDVNKLTLDEVDSWDAALERWGLWEERAALPRDQRVKFLTDDCASENRSIILALFRNSRIAEKINQIVNFFLKDGGH